MRWDGALKPCVILADYNLDLKRLQSQALLVEVEVVHPVSDPGAELPDPLDESLHLPDLRLLPSEKG